MHQQVSVPPECSKRCSRAIYLKANVAQLSYTSQKRNTLELQTLRLYPRILKCRLQLSRHPLFQGFIFPLNLGSSFFKVLKPKMKMGESGNMNMLEVEKTCANDICWNTASSHSVSCKHWNVRDTHGSDTLMISKKYLFVFDICRPENSEPEAFPTKCKFSKLKEVSES